MRAVVVEEFGPAENLRLVDLQKPIPRPGEVIVKVAFCGVNFIDVYFRTGLYKVPPPVSIGSEASGIVDAIGDGVTDLRPGDRVAYAMVVGAYAEARNIPADRLVKVPDGVSDQEAAALMLKGLTAHYLLRRSYRAQKGDTVLFHAAAGGVGLIACQWLKALGATVIGTVGSDAKAELARARGCDHPIVYTREDFPKRVRELTGGKGVPVVYDSVGKTTFQGSLDCLRPLGLMVSFGNASGAVPPFEPGLLTQKGSLYLTRPTLATYTATRADLEATAKDLFDMVLSGKVKIEINHTYALKDAAQVHRDLEGRKTSGSVVMLP